MIKTRAKRIWQCWDWISEQCQTLPDWVKTWIIDTCCKLSNFGVVIHGRSFEGQIARLDHESNIPLSDADLEEIAKAAIEAAEDAYFKISGKRGKDLQDFRCARDKSKPNLGFEKELERIAASTREAIDVGIQEILAEHEENQEATQPQLGFETVKYAMRGA